MRPIVRTLAFAAMLAFTACGQPVIDTDELEQQIATELEAQTGVTPSSVECPPDVPVEAGGTFNCTVTADDGSSANITVTQTDDEGGIEWVVDG